MKKVLLIIAIILAGCDGEDITGIKTTTVEPSPTTAQGRSKIVQVLRYGETSELWLANGYVLDVSNAAIWHDRPSCSCCDAVTARECLEGEEVVYAGTVGDSNRIVADVIHVYRVECQDEKVYTICCEPEGASTI